MTLEEYQEKYGQLPKPGDDLTSLSRFQYVQRAMMSPGKCAVCGGFSQDVGYIDWGLTLDFWGVVYICVPCVIEAVKVLLQKERESASSDPGSNASRKLTLHSLLASASRPDSSDQRSSDNPAEEDASGPGGKAPADATGS